MRSIYLMTIKFYSKLFLPVMIAASSTLFITGCDLFGSDDDNTTPVTPVVPPVPLVGITGIWTGSMTWDTTGSQKDYKVTMLFHMPDGEVRGATGGAAFGAGPKDPDEPHFLFEGGYEYFADPVVNEDQTIACDGDVWAVGRFGQQGTFIQEFKYTTGDVAGPDQRGGGCLYLRDTDGDGYVNELTGELQFEEAGKLKVALTYSTDNTRAVTVSDLGTLASDEGTVDVVYHLWSNDNSGNFMSYTTGAATADTIDLMVVEDRNDEITCGGNVKATKVAGQNLFTLATITDVAGCTVLLPGTLLPDNSSAKNVDLHYEGLGALYDLDADGKLEFIHLMASKAGGAGTTAQALYNQFIVQQ
jgi:hypothetical protein